MPPDTLLSLPKSQVKRQEVISGEFHPAAAGMPCWLRQRTAGCTAAEEMQKSQGRWQIHASKDGAAVLMSGARHNHCHPWGWPGEGQETNGKDNQRFKARVHEVA